MILKHLLYPLGASNPADRPRLRHVHRIAPWLAPSDGVAATPAPGHTLALACAPDGGSASLWLLGMEPARLPGPLRDGLAPMEHDSVEAIKNALAAANRAVPFMWTSLDELRRCFLHPQALRLQVIWHDPIHRPLRPLGGPSLGLSVGLAAISAWLRLPLPSDLLASAALHADGVTSGVSGLGPKLNAVAVTAPRVKRLLVAPPDAAAAHAAAERAGCKLEVVGVASLQEAVAQCWPDEQLQEHLNRLLQDPQVAQEIEASIFKICLGDQRSALRWAPLYQAAAQAHRALQGTEPTRAWRMAYAKAVAARYENRFEPLELPGPGHLAGLPLPQRLSLAAHIAQHSASWGSPDPAEARRWAEGLLPSDDLDAFPEHLKLRGALGRLCAAMGDLRAGLEHQRAVLRGWGALGLWGETSYATSEGFRVAAALEDLDALAALEQDYQRAHAFGQNPFMEFMDHHRCRARLVVQRGGWCALEPREAAERLRAIAHQERKPDNLLWLSRRWYVWGLRACEAHGEARAALEGYLRDPADHPIARSQKALMRLDEALHEGDPARTQAELEELRGLYPERFGFFCEAARGAGYGEAEWLARKSSL